MFRIDPSLIAKTKYYYLLHTQRANVKAYSNVDKTAEASANQDIKSTDVDYEAVIKALDLSKPANKLNILELLTSSQLIELLYLIDQEKLIQGLNFFTKDKLLDLIYDLPKEELLFMLHQLFTDEELIKMMPMKQIAKFLDSNKISHNDLLKMMKELPPHILAQIYENVNGKSAGNLSSKELYQKLQTIPQNKLVEGLQSLSAKHMSEVATLLVKERPELMLEFSKATLFKPFENMQKGNIIQSMQEIDPEIIIGMLSQLPQEMMAQVATMIDTEDLVGVLQNQYKDLLAALVS